MKRVALCALAAMLLLTAACTEQAKDQDGGTPRGSGTLRVLAASELGDMTGLLDTIAGDSGVRVELTQTGTLEGVEAVLTGNAAKQYDAIWFASNRYLELHPDAGSRIGTTTKIANSPVVLGVREPVARELGWDRTRPSWSQIATAAGEGKLSYGMTNPAASNSGFSALVGVASALAATGSALTAEQITPLTPRLRQFFSGQTLTAGSSGWLADAYLRAARGDTPIDGIVNYESVLLSLNAGGKLPEPLTIVYPSDGAVTADYPLTLLAGASEQARRNYTAVVEHLRRPQTQQELTTRTFRRPAVPGVKLGFAAPDGLPELPFPARIEAADALIAAFGDSLRRPARTIYVLDTSGSMRGDRIAGLKNALRGLTGVDQSLTGRFSRFNGREQVIMLPFNTRVGQSKTFDVPETDLQPTLDAIRGYADGLREGGDTAIYDALSAAYALAAPLVAAEPDRFTSIVLLTDGQRTTGSRLADFTAAYAKQPAALKGIPVFPILFGEGDVAEMTEVATVTGGRTFDARSGSLTVAFRDIRGYQ